MAETDPQTLAGLVLAGGRSSRLREAGAPDPDKGLASIHGETLVGRACRYLRAQGVDSILISANRHVERYNQYARVVIDPPEFGAFQGPLLGIAAALDVLEAEWLLVVPVDVLDLPADLATRLCQAADRQHPAYARTADGPHPLCLLAHRDSRVALRAWLAGGERKAQGWLAQVAARAVDFDGPGFLNLNTPDDWRRAGGSPP